MLAGGETAIDGPRPARLGTSIQPAPPSIAAAAAACIGGDDGIEHRLRRHQLTPNSASLRDRRVGNDRASDWRAW
jgi:hypothetical protein